jgi:hypothetical protein
MQFLKALPIYWKYLVHYKSGTCSHMWQVISLWFGEALFHVRLFYSVSEFWVSGKLGFLFLTHISLPSLLQGRWIQLAVTGLKPFLSSPLRFSFWPVMWVSKYQNDSSPSWLLQTSSHRASQVINSSFIKGSWW